MSTMYAMPPRATGSIGPVTPDPQEKSSGGRAGSRARAGNSKSKGAPGTKEEEVLQVAAEYFLRHGYQGTSINAMARASGISKESIYRYFNSKKHLFEAVIERELQTYESHLGQVGEEMKRLGLRAALVTIAEAILSVVTTDRTLAMRRLICVESFHSPDVGQHYWEVGPGQAYRLLENLFADHGEELKLGPKPLSQYFVAFLTHQPMLERTCAIIGPFTDEEIKKRAATVVDDFLKAFMRPSAQI